MSYLSDSIFVIVDCSQFTGRAREDLFMNSRDRLRGGDLRLEIEDALEDLLKNQQGLRDLRERRRREEIESKLADEKPLEDILESLLKASPSLSSLFLTGTKLSNPFKTKKVLSQEKLFKGKRHPTFFKFKDKDYGTVLQRQCHINTRCRITFETDVVNDYFSRKELPGMFNLSHTSNGSNTRVTDYVLNLENGIATLSIVLPTGTAVGDSLRFTSTVTDETLLEPFVNVVDLKVLGENKQNKGGQKRRKPSGDAEGQERERAAGIQLPKIKRVYEQEWSNHGFDKYTALKIKHAGDIDEMAEEQSMAGARAVYDFFVNMDNVYLKAELKSRSSEKEIVQARFIYGMTLIGLAVIHKDGQSIIPVENDREEYESEEEKSNVEKTVADLSMALAPVLLPMIESLGDLTIDDVARVNASAEAT